MSNQFAPRWLIAAAATLSLSASVQAADFGGRDGYDDSPQPYFSGGQDPNYESRSEDGDASVPEHRYSYRNDGGSYRDDDDDDDDFEGNDRTDDDDDSADDDDDYDGHRSTDRSGRYDGQRQFQEQQLGHRGRCLPGWRVKQRLEAEGWTRFRLAEFGEGVATIRAHRRQTNRPFLLKIDGCDGRTISSWPAGFSRDEAPGRQVYSGYKD